MKRVVITGYGAISSVGNDVGALWEALALGRSGVAPISSFPVGSFRPDYAAEARSFVPATLGLAARKLKLMGRHAQLALAATSEANDAARLIGTAEAPPPERVGIVLGTGMLAADVDELGRALAATARARADGGFDLVTFGRHGVAQLFPLWLLRHIPNMTSAHASIAFDLRGPTNTIMNGCTSALHALGEARRLIVRDAATALFAGGTDARISPLALLRYRDLGWLATRDDLPPTAVSAPFDAHATGFVCGEGAAVLVLEEMEAARARGARLRAEVVGYAAANEAGDPLQPSESGEALARAIASCLKQSALAPDEIDVVFAPANSLPRLDRAVARALEQIFGRRRVCVTTTRAALGHAHAASSAFDAVAAVRALETSTIPPTINLRRPIADFDFVADETRSARVEHALVAAYGFGGHAAAMVLRRVEVDQ